MLVNIKIFVLPIYFCMPSKSACASIFNTSTMNPNRPPLPLKFDVDKKGFFLREEGGGGGARKRSERGNRSFTDLHACQSKDKHARTKH